MSHHTYKTNGTCSSEISFDLIDGVVSGVHFERGCNGNGQGIATLANGMLASELIEKLAGICCGGRKTSCPDQLANALRLATEGAAE